MTEHTDHTVYRIIEIKNGQTLTLFHGMPTPEGKRSRVLPTGEWLRAEEKPVSYGRGSPEMISGFNVTKDLEQCRQYLSRFTAERDLRVVRCLARGLRPKPRAQAEIFLASELMILEEC
jgi:hypothetical protein